MRKCMPSCADRRFRSWRGILLQEVEEEEDKKGGGGGDSGNVASCL